MDAWVPPTNSDLTGLSEGWALGHFQALQVIRLCSQVSEPLTPFSTHFNLYHVTARLIFSDGHRHIITHIQTYVMIPYLLLNINFSSHEDWVALNQLSYTLLHLLYSN